MSQETTAKVPGTDIQLPAYLRFSKVIAWLMYVWVLIGIISLTLRSLLLMLSANLEVGFSRFVLNVSDDYLKPFRGIFPPKPVGTTGYLDVSALFAIIVYLFVAWGFSALIVYVQGKIDTQTEEQKKLHTSDK